ncbi:hypothetical protein FJT64_004820 [Amphibalanus amphitrite]|uniref:Chitin-binding type-2 domain-containing protein n=1 Tax=Amphibalanus amphitrite TaxID=1232801 RepID=A0A6A4W7A5_AMPAM|nr:hypothetical protein FJT64_004820 [Amphibalanus amphitrite]
MYGQGSAAAQFRAFPGGRKASEDFDCPEDFGYYAHPTDCSKYYVCVFGGALEEVCTPGLVYSDELLTCDWPRNVQTCDPTTNTPRPRFTTVKITDPRTSARRTTEPLTAPTEATVPVARGRSAASRRRQPSRRRPVPNSLAETTRASASTRRGPVRPRLSSSSSSSSSSTGPSIADRLRLLDNLDQSPADRDLGFEGDNNKIVTRRQHKLLSPSSSSGRGRFQEEPAVQSVHDRGVLSKGTDAPVRLATLSSFSFGDTGTRFPPRAPSSPSTFVSSTRRPVFPSSSEPTTRRTVEVTSTPTAPTEPAYVAYVNDTVYDVYYIYDDDDLVYDDYDVASSTTENSANAVDTTTRRTTVVEPTSRPTAPATRRATTLGKTEPSELTSSRGSTLSSTRSSTLGSTRSSTLGSTRSSSLGSTRPSRPFSTLGSTRSSTLGSTRSSTLGSTRSSTLGSTRSSSRIAFPSTFVPNSGRDKEEKDTTEKPTTSRGRQTFVRPSASAAPVTSSRRTPSTGLKSIESPSTPRRTSSLVFPKKSKNTVVDHTPKKITVVGPPPSRPAPLYPQPLPDQPAERCDARCKLPDCSCGGTATPGLYPEEIPQLVLLTFDDAVSEINRRLYKEMFEEGRKNPNGCPISATFYLSHEWTDYAHVQNLWADGHEIASHSVS